MRNLWIFLSKYNAFFFFVFFMILSLIMVIKNNAYQRSSFINSSAFITGQAYERINNFKSYLDLKTENDQLLNENQRLRNQLKNSWRRDTVQKGSVTDSLKRQQYSYIVARVINNSVNQKDNYITIDRGTGQGIVKGMGVITGNGVIGVVKEASENFATIATLLNSDTHISATIAGSNAFGSLIWGEENNDPSMAILQDIGNEIQVKPGQKIVTTEASALFPGGHPIGVVKRVKKNSNSSLWNIEVKLYTDFQTLKYVYVIDNLLGAEQQELQNNVKQK